MADLRCSDCDPIEPTHGRSHYPIDRIRIESSGGMVDPDGGRVFRSDHTHDNTLVYAECSRCGAILYDRRDEGMVWEVDV